MSVSVPDAQCSDSLDLTAMLLKLIYLCLARIDHGIRPSVTGQGLIEFPIFSGP